MKGSFVLLNAIVVSGAMAQPFANAFARSSVVADVSFSEVQPLANGNFAVAVRSSTGSFLYILRPAGTVVAGRSLAGFPGQSISVKSLSISPTGDIYTLSDAPVDATTRQVYVHKFDSAGTLLWRRNYDPGAGTYETISDSVCDAAGNLLFIGHASAAPMANSTSWMMRVRPNATISFNSGLAVSTTGTTLAVSPTGQINALAQGADRSYFITIDNTNGNLVVLDDFNAGTVLTSMAMRGGVTYMAGRGIPVGDPRPTPYVVANSSSAALTNWTSFLPMGVTATSGSFASIAIDGSGNPIVGGSVSGTFGQGVAVKVNKDSGFFTWTRTFGASGNGREFAGLGVDAFNESYLAMRNLNPDGERIRIEKIGPAGSLRGGVTFPGSSSPSEAPLSFAVHPRMGHFATAGAFGMGASRWVGFYQQAILGADFFATVMNSAIDVNVFTNDRYVGDVGATITVQPEHGTLTFNGVTGALNYMPDFGYEGEDSFTYRIQKPGLPAVTAVANIIIDTGGE